MYLSGNSMLEPFYRPGVVRVSEFVRNSMFQSCVWPDDDLCGSLFISFANLNIPPRPIFVHTCVKSPPTCILIIFFNIRDDIVL